MAGARESPATAPATPDAQAGQQIFLSAACVTCHTVRGTPALARLGPDLTHVASRRSITAGTLPNDTADLEAWITHAQSLEPGVTMPDLPQFTGKDLRNLVAYVQSLK